MLEEIEKRIKSKNIAEDLSQAERTLIAGKIIEWYDSDELSRSEWRSRSERWLKLATQVIEQKTWPWPKASNVKFPLLTTAAMQFAARAYPALVPGPNLVQGLVVGRDEGGQKQEAATRVGRHMSWQLLNDMPGWEEDMDKLCLMLPIMGCLFKKTYFDPLLKKNVSELVLPGDLVIDYYAKSLETAARKSHVIYRDKNQIKERINRGLFLDVDLGIAQTPDDPTTPVKESINGTKEPTPTPATPFKLIECHCWWDMDNDGYDEPYIITVDYQSRQLLRIVTRYDSTGIEVDVDSKGKQKIIKITPTEYFTKFGFIPNPDGGIYDLGFGLLLGGINESVDTLTNQLIDSGTINNMQAGFLGRGIRVKSGNTRFLPGEWKPVDFTGDDIKKHIFPLPTKEPSETLFKLLETLVTSGKELASVAEIMVGKMPGQNTPATTTMATIEQGLKVFTAIYKRIYRALGQEYQKLFKLNKENIDPKVYFTINQPEGPTSQEVNKEDYANELAVKPNADPNIVSSAQKLMKVQSYGSLLQLGTINPQEYTKRYLEAVEAESITKLMQVQPQPNPEQQKMQAEMQLKQQEAQQKAQIEQMKAALAQQKAELDARGKELELRIRMAEAQMEEQARAREEMHEAKMRQMDMVFKEAEGRQKLAHKDQDHKQKLTQAKENANNAGSQTN